MRPFKSNSVYVEIRLECLRLFDGESGLEIALERTESGRLTESSRRRAAEMLRNYSLRKQLRDPVAFCALGARGVSLRTVSLPASARLNPEELLRLQIEKEFPLGPDALAWGYMSGAARENGGTGAQEFIVIALKKEIVTEYAELMASAGYDARFTLGALAAARLVPIPLRGTWAFLDLQSSEAEWVLFRDGLPSAVRVIPRFAGGTEAFEAFAANVKSQCAAVETVFVSGKEADSIRALAQSLAPVKCEWIGLPQGDGVSAATAGLKQCDETGAAPILIRTETAGPTPAARDRYEFKWAAICAALLVALFSLRYIEVWWKKPALEKRLAELKTATGKLPNLDGELGFFQYLETNQLPCLQVITALSEAAPKGTLLENLTVNRRGDISMRGTMQNPQHATEFRSKLIQSGLFSTVVVDEQTPGPDRRRLSFRISARWLSKTAASAPARTEPKGPTAPSTNSPARTITATHERHENIN